MKSKTAILMMAYGGPNTLDDVEPYLLDVRGGRHTSTELIEEVRGRYAAIGGKSPLLAITCEQAAALEQMLNAAGKGEYQVFVGMRHWYPYIRETVAHIAEAGLTNIIAICMTPFFSRMSNGAYHEHLERAIAGQEHRQAWYRALSVRKVGAWYTHPTYLQALAANVTNALAGFPGSNGVQPTVVFTAHSLPAMLAEQGDPYADQFADLAQRVAVQAGLPEGQWLTSFQSAGAQNTRWLGPALEETIPRLASEGKTSLLVAPIGFLSDHVEVLYDIDIEAQRIAAEAGVRLKRTSSLNDQPLFIRALCEIVQQEEKA